MKNPHPKLDNYLLTVFPDRLKKSGIAASKI